ncbi:hypothetical protein LP422_24010 [Janibacter limosus]|uniref:hypothetical protein n=1 Tax=Janibacter limosus TaxID=53458 RepID=UPI0035D6C671|nr:hypothetical protein LP422_24010 [Janibacter limosus]
MSAGLSSVRAVPDHTRVRAGTLARKSPVPPMKNADMAGSAPTTAVLSVLVNWPIMCAPRERKIAPTLYARATDSVAMAKPMRIPAGTKGVWGRHPARTAGRSSGEASRAMMDATESASRTT